MVKEPASRPATFVMLSGLSRVKSRGAKHLLFTLILSVLAFILVLHASAPYGIGLSPDSAAYISAARGLLRGEGLVSFDGAPVLSWPPAFPAFLSIPGTIGIDPLIAARYLNALLFALIVFLGTLHLKKNLRDVRLVWIGACSLLLAEPLMVVSTRVWSEPLFICLVVCYLILLQRFLETSRTSELIAAMIIAALATLTRYIGVTLVIAGGLTILLRSHPVRRRRLMQSVGFVLLSSLPILIWLVRNYLTAESLTGPRLPGTVTLVQTIGRMLGALAEWFLPSLGGILILSAMSRRGTRRRDSESSSRPSMPVAAWFTVVYAVILCVSATLVAHDKVDHRLMSPVYIPLLFLLLSGLDRRPRPSVGEDNVRSAVTWLTVAVSLWLLWPAIDTGIRVSEYRQNGIPTFSTRTWQESELMQDLIRNRPHGRIFSNAPDAIYLRTGFPAMFTPYRDEADTPAASNRRVATLKQAITSDSDVYVAWFTLQNRPYLLTLDELSAMYAVERLKALSDGSLYRVSLHSDDD